MTRISPFAITLFAVFSFSLSAQSITVTKPAANESWTKGESHTIQWTKQGEMPTQVRIVLRKRESAEATLVIADQAPNSGSYQWLVPTTVPDGEYVIRVRVKTAEISDESAGFSIVSSSAGLQPAYKAVRPGSLKGQPVAYSIKVVAPTAGDSYHQLDTINIRVQANTGPADGTGDGFDLDLYNEAGTAMMADILSGAMTQTAPGIYVYAWKMPLINSIPDGKYTVRARSWSQKITGFSAPFWIRIPGAEETITIESVIVNNWIYKKEPSGPKPTEHVVDERPGEARIGWYYSGTSSIYSHSYLGIIYRAQMQFPIDYLKPRLARLRKATLTLRQTQFGVRKNVGVRPWTIGKLLILKQSWNDFFDTPSIFFKDVPINAPTEWSCDVTGLVRDWLGGAKPNHGILVTAESEGWLRDIFCYAVSFYKGKLDLTFFEPVN
jgi:hypothetical protein